MDQDIEMQAVESTGMMDLAEELRQEGERTAAVSSAVKEQTQPSHHLAEASVPIFTSQQSSSTPTAAPAAGLDESSKLLLKRVYQGLLYSIECQGRKRLSSAAIRLSYLPATASSAAAIGTGSAPKEIQFNFDSLQENVAEGPPKEKSSSEVLKMLLADCMHASHPFRVIPASCVVGIQGLEDVISEILHDVKASLFTEHEDITARLHSLRILPAGNCLSSSKVEALDDECIGVLIVTLPFTHRGGNIEISCYGNTITHMNETFLCLNGQMSYSAFHLETTYRIEEVYSEAKVMLFYSIHGNQELAAEYRKPFFEDVSHGSSQASREIHQRYHNLTLPNLRELCELRGMSAKGNKSELVQRLSSDSLFSQTNNNLNYRWPSIPKHVAFMKAKCLRNALCHLLLSEDFLPSGGKLGFPLFHIYQYEAELPSIEELSAATAENVNPTVAPSHLLKGADSLLLLALRRTCMKVNLLRLGLFIDGPIFIQTILSTMPNMDVSLLSYSQLRDHSAMLDSIFWALDQSCTPLALLREGLKTYPTGNIFNDGSGTGRFYSKAAATVEIPPYGSVQRHYLASFLYQSSLDDSMFENIKPGATPQIEAYYAKLRFHYHVAQQERRKKSI